MKTNISTAKITRPKLSGIFPRQRLFKLLDGDRKKPVTALEENGSWLRVPGVVFAAMRG
jgi:hypothetical protein